MIKNEIPGFAAAHPAGFTLEAHDDAGYTLFLIR
jgi:hypothetical protein